MSLGKRKTVGEPATVLVDGDKNATKYFISETEGQDEYWVN